MFSRSLHHLVGFCWKGPNLSSYDSVRERLAKSHPNLLSAEGVFADGCEMRRAGRIGTVCDAEVWRSFGSVLFRFIWEKQQHTLQVPPSSTQNTFQLLSKPLRNLMQGADVH